MNEKILILGGTREADKLAQKLIEEGHQVITSLAGRTKEPKPLSGKIIIGGFGGANGLADYLVQNAITRLIDATHPFAKQISKNAIEAARLANIPLEIKTREPWQKQDGDNWIEVTSEEEACDRLPPNARALLALGSQHIEIFARRNDVFYLVRMVDEPETPLALPSHEVLIGKPPIAWQEEKLLLTTHTITHIICRNSGGEGAYAKIIAARELGLPVIMINR